MNVVDSSGWVEYLTDGGNAGFFAPIIHDVENLIIPTICFYEVFKRVLQEFGEERALSAVGIMSLGQIVNLDRQTAIEAAQISVESKLALADSIILASARSCSAALWTQDAHFMGMEGVNFIEKRP